MESGNKATKDDERWLKQMAGPEQWRANDAERVIAAWQASGKSLAEFCYGYGINAQRITWWRKRLPTSAPPLAPAMEFVPVTVREPAGCRAPAEGNVAPVVLAIAGVGRIEVAEPEGVSPAWIAALVRELARAGGVA